MKKRPKKSTKGVLHFQLNNRDFSRQREQGGRSAVTVPGAREALLKILEVFPLPLLSNFLPEKKQGARNLGAKPAVSTEFMGTKDQADAPTQRSKGS